MRKNLVLRALVVIWTFAVGAVASPVSAETVVRTAPYSKGEICAAAYQPRLNPSGDPLIATERVAEGCAYAPFDDAFSSGNLATPARMGVLTFGGWDQFSGSPYVYGKGVGVYHSATVSEIRPSSAGTVNVKVDLSGNLYGVGIGVTPASVCLSLVQLSKNLATDCFTRDEQVRDLQVSTSLTSADIITARIVLNGHHDVGAGLIRVESVTYNFV